MVNAIKIQSIEEVCMMKKKKKKNIELEKTGFGLICRKIKKQKETQKEFDMDFA